MLKSSSRRSCECADDDDRLAVMGDPAHDPIQKGHGHYMCHCLSRATRPLQLGVDRAFFDASWQILKSTREADCNNLQSSLVWRKRGDFVRSARFRYPGTFP